MLWLLNVSLRDGNRRKASPNMFDDSMADRGSDNDSFSRSLSRDDALNLNWDRALEADKIRVSIFRIEIGANLSASHPSSRVSTSFQCDLARLVKVGVQLR